MGETKGKASLTCLLAIAEAEASELEAENGRLRERITTQGQTIQAYRDESREWREVAERAQAENEQLRELVSFVLRFETMTDGCGDTCPYVCLNCKNECYFRKVAGELGIEVGE